MLKRERKDMFFFFFIMALAIGMVVASVMGMDDNICDTPWGARDVRCVGYYTRFPHR